MLGENRPGVGATIDTEALSSTPTADLSVPGRLHPSVMDWLAERGFDGCCVDMEGDGRSGKPRDTSCDIASTDDLIAFFVRLPSPDEPFTMMNGIPHASFQQRNDLIVYQILHAFFTQPAPVYSDSGH